MSSIRLTSLLSIMEAWQLIASRVDYRSTTPTIQNRPPSTIRKSSNAVTMNPVGMAELIRAFMGINSNPMTKKASPPYSAPTPAPRSKERLHVAPAALPSRPRNKEPHPTAVTWGRRCLQSCLGLLGTSCHQPPLSAPALLVLLSRLRAIVWPASGPSIPL